MKHYILAVFLLLSGLCLFLYAIFEEFFEVPMFNEENKVLCEQMQAPIVQAPPTTSVNCPTNDTYQDAFLVPSSDTLRTAEHKKKVWELLQDKKVEVTFVHVHKAGGTSIRNNLMDVLKKQGYKTSVHESYSTVWRGFGGPIKKWISEHSEDMMFVIAFRHPIDRFLSQYDFEVRFGCQICDRPNDILWRISMEDYFTTMGRGLTRQLEDKYDGFRGPHARNHVTKLLACHNDWGCELTEKHLEHAKAVINSFDLVLIMEWLDDPRSLLMIETVIGIKFSTEHKRSHGSKRVNALSPKLRRKLEEWNKWDLRLYEYATELVFERMWSLTDGKNKLLKQKYLDLLKQNKYWKMEAPS